MLNKQAGLNELRQTVLIKKLSSIYLLLLIIVLFFIVLFDIFRYLHLMWLSLWIKTDPITLSPPKIGNKSQQVLHHAQVCLQDICLRDDH